MASVGAVHNEHLPEAYASKIPVQDLAILHFFLAFLAAEGLPEIPVFVNGGYVRDLLLGKEPDDLDISLCLRDCGPAVTVASLMEKLPAFAVAQPELGQVLVKVATVLSNESKDKNVDTFKAHLTNAAGHKVEVDVMPTIGEEVYGEDSRIPIRDQRGTAEQDALRRDLTIGAMLIRVQRGDALSFRLLDFYGGIEDLRQGVLRAPSPLGKSVAEVETQVLRTNEDRALAERLGICAMDEVAAVQVLWWAKILVDDPLRICRAMRFEAKLQDFELHEAFWLAVPFAVEKLRSKVAGGRKNTEYQKIGGYGYQACASFVEAAFSKSFGNPAARLAVALFGGCNDKGRNCIMSEIESFDLGAFRAISSPAMVDVVDAAELCGALLAAAIVSATFAGRAPPHEEFRRACDGLCVSKAMRQAGQHCLEAATRLATCEIPTASSLERSLAAACGLEESTFCQRVFAWEVLQSLRPSNSKEVLPPEHRRRLVLGILRRDTPERADVFEPCFQALGLLTRPAIRGGVLGTPSVLEVPHRMRCKVMSLLEVTLRQLRYNAPVENAEQLLALFEVHPKLREALSSNAWFESDGRTLRSEFNLPPAKVARKK